MSKEDQPIDKSRYVYFPTSGYDIHLPTPGELALRDRLSPYLEEYCIAMVDSVNRLRSAHNRNEGKIKRKGLMSSDYQAELERDYDLERLGVHAKATVDFTIGAQAQRQATLLKAADINILDKQQSSTFAIVHFDFAPLAEGGVRQVDLSWSKPADDEEAAIPIISTDSTLGQFIANSFKKPDYPVELTGDKREQRKQTLKLQCIPTPEVHVLQSLTHLKQKQKTNIGGIVGALIIGAVDAAAYQPNPIFKPKPVKFSLKQTVEQVTETPFLHSRFVYNPDLKIFESHFNTPDERKKAEEQDHISISIDDYAAFVKGVLDLFPVASVAF